MCPVHQPVAVVTGGASGIGKALCEELARQGHRVVVADVNEAAGEAVAASLRAVGATARFVALDVRDAERFEQVLGGVVEEFGQLDFLFNNAGVVVFKTAVEHTREDWDLTVGVNLHGAINGCRAAMPHMLRQGRGHIVNTSSIAGLAPLAEYPVYGVTKFAVVGLSLNLRSELAAKGVKVSVLCPGGIRTQMTAPLTKRFKPEQAAVVDRVIPPPEALARRAVKALRRNPAIVVFPWWYRLVWWTWRLFPGLFLASQRRRA
jgi:NAD(P)-dependent dehydrogenase (short-subunit alcohol dehydrogenase family)